MNQEQLRDYISANRTYLKVFNIGKAAGISKNRMTQFLKGTRISKEDVTKIYNVCITFQKLVK